MRPRWALAPPAATLLTAAPGTRPATDAADDPDETEGPIEPDKTPAEIRQTPYQLPAGFEWTEVDVNDDAQARSPRTP